MKSITFKKRGLAFILHKFAFSKDPSDTCTYKKELIFSTIVFLVTLHASILRSIFFAFPQNRINRDDFGLEPQLIAMFLAIISVGIGVICIEDTFLPDFIYWTKLTPIQLYLYSFIAQLIGVIVISIGLGVLILICVGLYKLYEVFANGFNKIKRFAPSLENEVGESNTQVGVLYQSAKERWCKKIDWE